MYPWQPSLPRGQKCEKKPPAAGEQRAKKNEDDSLHIHLYITLDNRQWPLQQLYNMAL